jgi:peptidoglycan biosynthesis protein MviN/MurJ (putative lipid II flippase)
MEKLRKIFIAQFRLERIVQIYLGIFLLSNVGVGWLIPLSELKLPHEPEVFITQLWQINILMPTVKLIEFVAAFMFLFNWNSFLALLIFYPVLFNIICIGLHFFGSVQYSALMIAGVLYLTWMRRNRFKAFFQSD